MEKCGEISCGNVLFLFPQDMKDGFGGFDCSGGSGEHLALLLLALQNTVPRGDRGGFDGFGGFRRLWRFRP